MIEFLQKFQYLAGGLQSFSLLALAIVTIAVGVFIWLGGLGLRRTMFVIVGACCGLAVVISLGGTNILLVAALLGLGILLALKLQDRFLMLTASIFAAVYGFSILIRPYFNASEELIVIIRQLTTGVPYYNWPILLFLIAIPFAAGASSWRVTSAALCSVAGAGVMLAGAVMLMVRSGIAAAGLISTKREIFLEMFIVVAVIGAIAQLLLLPKLTRRVKAAGQVVKGRAKRLSKAKSDAPGEPRRPKITTWRTA